jgi:hypothetical protein
LKLEASLRVHNPGLAAAQAPRRQHRAVPGSQPLALRRGSHWHAATTPPLSSATWKPYAKPAKNR